MDEPNGFYRDQVFQMIKEGLTKLNDRMDKQDVALNDIKAQMKWIYGWAAGIGFAASFLWAFVKDKLKI